MKNSYFIDILFIYLFINRVDYKILLFNRNDEKNLFESYFDKIK